MEKVINYKGIDLIISDDGIVKRCAREVLYKDGRKRYFPESEVVFFKDADGYYVTNLKINNKRMHIKLHRLLAEAFIPNPDNLPCVNHKDENPSNCSLDNLEWCTKSYNNNYGTAKERRRNNRSIGITQVFPDGSYKDWKSGVEIERDLGFKHSLITRCCKGKCKQAYGFVWRYTCDQNNVND